MRLKLLLFAALLSMGSGVIAQEVDLFKMLEEESKKEDKERTDFTTATFKTTRLINGHTVENVGDGVLDAKISHRFGTLNRGGYELFGLDNAMMRMGLDYGLSDRLMIGVGRNTFEKQYDGFVKYKLFRQSKGKRTFPVSVSLVGSVMLKTLKDAEPATKKHFSDKLYYSYQLLLARKFSESTSLQLMPTVVHHNLVQGASDPNDIIALGFGGRQKISKRVSINGEYYYVLPGHKLPGTYNSLSFGVDIETGGHVFQLHFTNTRGMSERTFISETTGQWQNGDIHFGFNISRVFSLHSKKKQKNTQL
jgi:hypothetical protein